MTDDLDVAIRHVRTVALWHPTLIRRAPIGMYYLYEDRRIRLRVSDQVGLDDYGVWVPARGDDWATVLLWSPYMAAPGQPQVFIPGDWIPYLRAFATCRSRQLLFLLKKLAHVRQAAAAAAKKHPGRRGSLL